MVWRYADTQLRAQFATGGSQLAQAMAQGRGQVTALALQGEAQVAAAVGTAVQQQVIPAVRQQVQQQLTASGITPQLMQQLAQTLALARSAGALR